jgi:WD40 repeat protein
LETDQFGSVHCVAYSQDGRWIATGTDGRSVKLFDAHTGQSIVTMLGHDEAVMAVTFSPDARTLASGSVNGTVKLWDVFTGQCMISLNGPTGMVNALAFSPDGTRLAAGGKTPEGRGEVHLWYAPRAGDSEYVGPTAKKAAGGRAPPTTRLTGPDIP